MTFAHDFHSAFDRVSMGSAVPGTADLLTLRNALPQYTRAEFDAGLTDLRDAEVYSLNQVEGRFPLSPEQRAATIGFGSLDWTGAERRYFMVIRK